jgi:phage host-nuclease inhibitor protein Gam
MGSRTNGEVNELNTKAVADNLAELREHYELRLTALENEVASMRVLVQNQSRVIGEAMARMMGSGSTERE